MTTRSKEVYEETVASQIKAWDDEIEHLDAKADILMAQIEDRYYNLIGCLRTKENELKQELAALRTANEGDEKWVQIKDQIVHTADDMKDALYHAVEEIERES